ncbi:mismatch-specific DNA-glycosylase [Laceyella putida]|uniref:Mismatch-specific DNA-glycosylase n=1 Tax=Laceyella putida TaxID=110101 RepID=A0ABW2RFL5_9BACL
MPSIPDHLAPNLDVLFVGFNPSLKSGETGHHYANPHNRFWKILHQSGLTPRLYRAEEDGELLKLGYGFTNIVARPTQSAAEITKEEYRAGRRELKQKIETVRPRVVCFVGKGVYTEYSGRRNVAWGLQETPVVPGVQEFVAPSSSGLVRMKLDEIVAIYAGLARLIKPTN